MDVNQDELQLKKLLVDLEDEHNHLQASVRHLKNEVEKRELEVRSLLSQRELDIAKGRQHQQKQPEKPTQILESKSSYSSDFVRQVNELLDQITAKSEEISGSVKL